MVILIIGVSGSGKTTIGRLLAHHLGCRFADADDWHSDDNLHKMSQGISLTDGDRHPWLTALVNSIGEWLANDESVVLACSALKQSYREQLSNHHPDVQFVYLKGSFELIKQRLQTRREHFMPVTLLESQFAALEEPDDAIVVDVDQDSESIISAIVAHLKSFNCSGLQLS